MANVKTLNDLWAEIRQSHYPPHKRWSQEVARLYARHVEPGLGRRAIIKVDYAGVHALHHSLRGTPTEANRTLAVLSRILRIAERLGERTVGSNPCPLVDRYRETSRQRYASIDEIGRIAPLLSTASQAHPREAAFLWLLLLTGARPSEIEAATWGDFTENPDGTATVRLQDGKTGHRTIFLPAQAVAVLRSLPDKAKTLTGAKFPRRLWQDIRRQAGCPDLWARDLRRTFATVGMSNGISAGMVGELLGHKSAQTTKIYAKLMQQPAQDAAAAIAGKIQDLIKS